MSEGEDKEHGTAHAGLGDEVAAGWVVRMASDQRIRGDADSFAEWLEADPANAEEYAAHDRLWQGMAALADDEEARAILGLSRPAPEVVPLPGQRGLTRRQWMGAAIAGLAVAASVGFVALPLLSRQVYETVPGEQRRVTLADGSSMMLNTDTRVAVAFDDGERRLTLERGQAWFEVAKDPARPFRVFVGQDEVRAIGTAFDVRRIGDRARVTLTEGVVALYRGTADKPARISGRAGVTRHDILIAGPSAPVAVLRAGQQAELVTAAAAPVPVAEVDLRKEQAWRFGRMVLDGAPLDQTIADLNRYGGRRIELADPALGQLEVSGVFHTNSPDAFVDGVTAALPLRVQSEDATRIVLGPR